MTAVACDKNGIASPLPARADNTERYCQILLELQRRADAAKLADTAGRSMDSYHHDVRQFVEYLRANELALVDGLEAWIREAKQRYRARTVNRKLAAIRARILGNKSAAGLVDVLEDELPASTRARLEAALRKIKGMKVNSSAVRGSKIMDYQSDLPQLLDAITDPAVKLVVEAMANTGARISEVLTAELAWCEREGDKVHIWLRGKGDKEREAWIPAGLYQRIVAHCGSRRWLFEHTWYGERRPYNTRSMTTRIARWTQKALGRRLSAHAMRHSFATHMLRDQGKDPKIVAKLLGHKSITTTLAIYDGYIVSADDAEVKIG